MRNILWMVGLSALPLLGQWTPPEVKLQLPVQGKIEHAEITESSGLVQSRKVPGRFWTHNDSGGKPQIFPLNAKGESVGEPVTIQGVKNIDWEDIATDDKGQLWIADLGNNLNRRKDLIVYVVDEPGEEIPAEIPVKQVLRVEYPDQEAFPPEKMNFDGEGIFIYQDKLHVLTKHRSDADTKLYRLDEAEGEEIIPLTLLGRIENIGVVTAADLHPDTRRLAILTFTGVWIFDRGEQDDFLKAKRFFWRIPAWGLKQAEAICWLDEETLLIGNEQRQLFQLKVGEIPEWKGNRVVE